MIYVMTSSLWFVHHDILPLGMSLLFMHETSTVIVNYFLHASLPS